MQPSTNEEDSRPLLARESVGPRWRRKFGRWPYLLCWTSPSGQLAGRAAQKISNDTRNAAPSNKFNSIHRIRTRGDRGQPRKDELDLQQFGLQTDQADRYFTEYRNRTLLAAEILRCASSEEAAAADVVVKSSDLGGEQRAEKHRESNS